RGRRARVVGGVVARACQHRGGGEEKRAGDRSTHYSSFKLAGTTGTVESDRLIVLHEVYQFSRSFRAFRGHPVLPSCRMSRLGLIAGNGRFPFLVLQAARSLGHDVTIVAVKEEAFPDLETDARSAGAAFHWVSLGQLGACIRILKAAGVSR